MDSTFIRIDHSTIDSFVMISFNMPHIPPDHTTWGSFEINPQVVLISDAMPWSPSKRCLGSLAISSPACLFPVLLERNLLLSSLLGGVATQLPLGLGLHGALGSADGGGTGDSGFTEVGAVSGLGGGGGNVLEGPA